VSCTAASSSPSPPSTTPANACIPTSKRHGSVLPRSHKDSARKAFEKITKKLLPASYTQLQRALNAEAKTYRQRVDELDHPPAAPRDTAATVDADEPTDDDRESQDLDKGSTM
jgi:hypothetical protein